MNLVFASGLFFPQKIFGGNYFRDLPSKYPDACFPDAPVAGAVQERACTLANQIARHFPQGEMHIICAQYGMLGRPVPAVS